MLTYNININKEEFIKWMIYKSAFLLSFRKPFFILYLFVGQMLPQGERKLMNNLKMLIFVSSESNKKNFQG